ncbi:sensor histidine kinase [Anaeromicropila herbilytica]|uniref:histidine kinase n=1 Tax=Anaeromicropila herbilytica TaxID=2785025 RepID=A0A7R7IF48_9FIRM|nr:HAMP domain-containing sensor histidine kinase [Anaeromicropila herbilytica]BCN31778.1 two-component sensor histidine kinase [Anaeromicropila herbilytica]
MKHTINKINLITTTFIVVVLILSMILSVNRYLNTDDRLYDNQIRMLVAEQRNDIEKGIYHKGKYTYMVLGLEGKVKYNNSNINYKKDDIVNVQEMIQTDQSFNKEQKNVLKESFILQKDGKTDGFVVFYIPKDDIIKGTPMNRALHIFFPILVGVLLSAIMLIIRTVYSSKRILYPLREISTSAKAIIAGNYNLEVVRTYGRTIGENEVGDLTYSFELMRDELKEKQVREESLKRSQQELISCISHDLKTPISTIKAYSEGLRDGIAKTEEAKAEYVKIIISKTDLLIGMINDLLEYSNAQLQQLDINRSEVYFLDYFIPLMKEIEIYIRQMGLEFTYRISTDNMIVTIDKKRITEVIYNIIENSMKYTSNYTGKITIDVERKDKCVLIRIKDNGIGISSDDIPYVFDKFYRAEKSRSSSIPGSGLGLSICKYIVNEHGGEIYCKSRYNQGCEIGFTLQ